MRKHANPDRTTRRRFTVACSALLLTSFLCTGSRAEDTPTQPPTVLTLPAKGDLPTDSPVLGFVRQLVPGRTLHVRITHDGTDAYRFSVAEDGTMDVTTGSERGVLYAAYDVLDGKTSGDESPAFSIRGIFPCDCTQRHTPAMMRKLIDRTGRWRMNVLAVITQYGFREHKDLITRECAKRGIKLVHYTYYNLAFCKGIPKKYFAVDEQGNPQPPFDHLECTDRLCASNPEGLDLYRQGVRRYLREHPEYQDLVFATADGWDYCMCPSCRKKNTAGQAMPFFDIFFDEAKGRRPQYLAYFQRYVLPKDLSRIKQVDAVMFDDHTRNPHVPLHDPELKAGRARWHEGVDPRAKNTTRNRYLYDRLAQWRNAYPGKLYLHENLMIQGSYGVPRFNTQVYLEDLRQFKKMGIDGVLYEAFEPGIRPILPTLDTVAKALWNPDRKYEVNDDAYPELHEFYDLVHESHKRRDWKSCGNLMRYLLARPDRDQFDWLFIGYDSMWRANRRQPLATDDPEVKEFLEKRKLWDFMEPLDRPRETTGRVIEKIVKEYL